MADVPTPLLAEEIIVIDLDSDSFTKVGALHLVIGFLRWSGQGGGEK